MKSIVRYISALLVLCFLFASFPVSADNDSQNTLSIVNINVAGLPEWISGTEGNANQIKIGQQLTAGNYDVIAVQEDFGYHSNLVNHIAGYPYITNHSGGVPAGDGLNVFSKYPVYHETRVAWNQTYGILTDGSDELTPKGILYVCIELEDGVYLDFYDIHADAFDDFGSRAAREDNYRQLTEMILKKSNDRPIIVTGDFNTYSHLDPARNSNFRYYFYEQLGLKNAWTEIHNAGNYEDYSEWISTGDNWGKWDSVEMFLYKSGGGVELNVTDFAYHFLEDENGMRLSDHAAATAVFTYEKTDSFVENTQKMQVTKADPVKLCFTYVVNIFADLMKIFQVPKFI